MKTTICILGILILIGIGCTTTTAPGNTSLAVLIDTTDSVTAYPTSEGLCAQLGLNNDPWQGVQVYTNYINDKDVNPSNTLVLPTEAALTGNLVIRNAKIQHFQKQLQQCLVNMKATGTCPHSIIYRSIARQANTLAASGATKKYLLVYSNLYENSEVNFYDPQTMRVLAKTPLTIERQLQAQAQLSALAGVQVWLLYNPLSFTDNNRYMLIATFYKHLLEAHGATVHIDTKFQLP